MYIQSAFMQQALRCCRLSADGRRGLQKFETSAKRLGSWAEAATSFSLEARHCARVGHTPSIKSLSPSAAQPNMVQPCTAPHKIMTHKRTFMSLTPPKAALRSQGSLCTTSSGSVHTHSNPCRLPPAAPGQWRSLPSPCRSYSSPAATEAEPASYTYPRNTPGTPQHSRTTEVTYQRAPAHTHPESAPDAADSTTPSPVPPAPINPGSLVVFYADHWVVPLPEKHRFPMLKYSATRNALANDPSLSHCLELRPGPGATVSEVCAVHDAEYVQRFTSGHMTADEMRNVGFPWSEELVSSAKEGNGMANILSCLGPCCPGNDFQKRCWATLSIGSTATCNL